MKKLSYLLLAFVIFGCNPKNIDDCLKTEGDTVRKEFDVDFFDKVNPMSRVKMFIQSGPVQSVIVESGDNLIDDVEVTVNDGVLEVISNNGCNIFREFERVRVFVTTPNLTSIRNSSGYTIESIGVLDFPQLELISEDDGQAREFNTDGDFILELQSQTVTIAGNNISNFFLSGTVDVFNVGIFQGDGRVDTPNLIAQDVNILHRGSNKVIVNPQQSLRGRLLSTGDLISVNEPPIVEIEQLFTGRLIFE